MLTPVKFEPFEDYSYLTYLMNKFNDIEILKFFTDDPQIIERYIISDEWLKDTFYHKTINYNGKKFYVKYVYIYESFYKDSKRIIFQGRNEQGEHEELRLKIEYPRESFMKLLENNC